MCIVLGSLAEKMAGPSAILLFDENIQGYLMMLLRHGVTSFPKGCTKEVRFSTAIGFNLFCFQQNWHSLRMFALLALEKFAQTRENQVTIAKLFLEQTEHPLCNMESFLKKADWEALQEGFCAQWALDNICELFKP